MALYPDARQEVSASEKKSDVWRSSRSSGISIGKSTANHPFTFQFFSSLNNHLFSLFRIRSGKFASLSFSLQLAHLPYSTLSGIGCCWCSGSPFYKRILLFSTETATHSSYHAMYQSACPMVIPFSVAGRGRTACGLLRRSDKPRIPACLRFMVKPFSFLRVSYVALEWILMFRAPLLSSSFATSVEIRIPFYLKRRPSIGINCTAVSFGQGIFLVLSVLAFQQFLQHYSEDCKRSLAVLTLSAHAHSRNLAIPTTASSISSHSSVRLKCTKIKSFLNGAAVDRSRAVAAPADVPRVAGSLLKVPSDSRWCSWMCQQRSEYPTCRYFLARAPNAITTSRLWRKTRTPQTMWMTTCVAQFEQDGEWLGHLHDDNNR